MHVNVVMLTEFLVRLRDERKLVASMFMSYRSAVANIPPGTVPGEPWGAEQSDGNLGKDKPRRLAPATVGTLQ